MIDYYIGFAIGIGVGLLWGWFIWENRRVNKSQYLAGLKARRDAIGRIPGHISLRMAEEYITLCQKIAELES